LLEKNPEKINWTWLSENPNAIHLLEKNLDKVDWNHLSKNPNALHLLEQNVDKSYGMGFQSIQISLNLIIIMKK